MITLQRGIATSEVVDDLAALAPRQIQALVRARAARGALAALRRRAGAP